MADIDTQTPPPLPPIPATVTDDYANTVLSRLFPDSSQQPVTPEITPDSATASALKSAAAGVVPAVGAAAGAVKGAEVGAGIGALVPGADVTGIPELIGGAAGGLIGAIGGGIAASKAQQAALNKVAPKVEQQLAANEEVHPIASAIGDIASSLPAFEFAPGETVKGVVAAWKAARGVALDKAEKSSVMALAAQAGMGAGGAVISPLLQGQNPDLKDIGISTLTALVFGKPRDYIESTLGRLGLPKPQQPIAAEDVNGSSTVNDKGGAAQPDNGSVAPPISPLAVNNYDIPQPVKDRLTAIAQKESSVGFENLPPEDVRDMQNATDVNQGHADFHKDSLAFYTQQVALADRQKAADFATTQAHPLVADAMSGLNEAVESEGETPIDQQLASVRNEKTIVPNLFRSSALKIIDSNGKSSIVEAPTHAQAYPLTKGKEIVDEGFVTKSGQYISRIDSGDIAGFQMPTAEDKVTQVEPVKPTEPTPTAETKPDLLVAGKDFANMQRPHEVGVLDGLKMKPEDVPHLMDLQKQSVNEMTEAAAKDPAAFKSLMGKNAYLGGLIEGAKREGPNYEVVKANQLRAAEAAKKVTEPEIPAWQHPDLQPKQDELLNMTEGSEAQVKSKGVEANAKGQKRAQMFEDTADPDVIYTDARAGKNRQETRKLAAMQSPDGTHVITGSAWENNGKRMITAYDKDGKPKSRGFDDLIAEGWKPLASIKTNDATKGYVKTYSPDGWAKTSSDLRERVKADQRTAGAMEEHLAAGKEFGLDSAETEAAKRGASELDTSKHVEGEENESVTRHETFTTEHAEDIYDAIHGNVEGPEDVIDVLKENGRMLEFEAACRDAGLLEPGLIKTKEDAGRAAFLMATKIYDAYTTAGKDGQGFSESLHRSILDESGKQTAGTQPELLSKPAENAVTGSGKVAGDEGAGAGRAGAAKTGAGGEGDNGQPDGGTAAKPAGEPAAGAAKPAGSDAEGKLAKERTAQAKETVLRSRIAPERAAAIFRAVSYQLRSVGVDVNLLHESVSGMAKDAAKYEEWKNIKGELGRAITISMSDTSNPTSENLIALLHEAGHAVFARETPERQAMLHEAITKAGNDVLGLGQFFEKVTGRFMSEAERGKIAQEGRLVEATSRELVAQGFHPMEAASVIQRIGMALKNLYQRAAMAVMQSMGLPMSPERALAYFQTRMKLALTGGKADSIVSFLGGPRMTFEDYGGALGVSAVESYLSRNRDQSGVGDFNPLTIQQGSGDIKNPTEEKYPTVAAEAVVHNVMDAALKAFNEEGHNDAGISGEDLLKRFLPDEIPPAQNIQTINENLTRNGHQPVNPKTGLNDIANKAMRDEAAARAIHRLDDIKDAANAKRVEAERIVNRINKVLPKKAEEAATAIKNHADLELISGQAAVRMQEAIAEEVSTRGQVQDLSTQKSLLEQNIRQLDKDIQGNTLLPKPWQDALDRLSKRLGTGGDLKFSDMLQKLAEKQLDWNQPASDLAKQIREMISDPDLAPLQGRDHDSRALLATAITFAKKSDFLLNLLTLRKTKLAGEHAAINGALQTAMENNVNAIKEARLGAKQVNKLRPLLEKLLANVSQLKKDQREMLDERARQNKFITFHTLFNPVIDQALRPLEAQIGAIRVNVNIAPVTEVTTPPTATAKPEQFVAKKLIMSKADGTVTLTPEIREDIQKRQAWLDANKGIRDQLGAAYNYQEAVNRKLSEYLRVYGMATPIKEFWLAKWLAPTAEKLRLVGTPLARSPALMIEKANTIYNGLRTPGTVKAHQWEVARSEAMKAMGISNPDNFKNNVDDAFKDFSSKNKDARAKFSDPKQAAEAAVKAGMENLRQNPVWRDRLADPKRSKAVEDFFRKNVELNEWIAENGRNMGNKIWDPKLGLYRNPIGSAEAEYSRGLSTDGETMFQQMRQAWTGDIKPEDIAKLHAARDPALVDLLKPRFTPDVWSKFVRWVAYKDGTSPFSSPQRADGTVDYARRDNVIKAYENNRNNPLGFATDLFNLETQENPEAYKGADASKFVGDTMHSLQAQFEILKSMAGDVAEADGRGLPTPGRHLQDARMTDAAPRQFYSYVDYDRSNLPRLIRAQSYNAAFGRNIENFYQTMAAAEKEQQDLVNRYNTIAATFPDLTGKPLRKAVLAAAKTMTEDGTPVADGGKPIDVEALAQSQQRLRAVQKALNEQKANFTSNQGRPPELAVLSTLMHGIGSLTVSGPGTAIIAHTIAFEQMIRNFGLNPDGLKMLLATGRNVVTVALRGALQSFGHEMTNEGDHLAMLVKYGNQNPNTLNKWANDVKAIMIKPDYVDSVLGRGAIYAGRAMQTLAQRISSFHYAARVCQLASSKAWCDKIAGAIENGIQHFEDHPADRGSKDFQFSAKQLGLSGDDNGRAFKYLNYALSKYGLDMRQMVEDAMNRRAEVGKDAPLLTDDIYRKIAQASLDDNTLESSPTTRPAFLTNNYLGQLLNPMFGWAVEKSYAVGRAFREPNGEQSVNAFKTASLAYVGILPLAMVAAYLRNKFDEDVQGKKQNVSDLSTVKNAQDAFLTMIDNAARVGTFGIAGEAMNLGINKDNSRPLTLDGRLFVVSTIENTFGAISNLAHQRDFDYQTVVRPLLQSLGGNGFYQYAGIVNHTLGLDNAEARVMNRISVNNYLRVAGRQNDLDVRTYAGMMQTASQPNPWRAPIGNMVMAAYANDAQGFIEARNEAVQKLVEAGYKLPEARAKVLQSYEDSNPLQVVFRSKPSQAEYQKMLASMDENGRIATATAIRLYQHFGEQLAGSLGIQSKSGAEKQFGSLYGHGATAPERLTPTTRTGTGDATLDSMVARFRPQPITLDDLRRRASIGM